MTDREKLIKLVEDGFPKRFEILWREDCEELADYLLANGVIVPPCNLNDEVYCIAFDYAKNELVIRSGWVLEIIIKHETLYLKIADRVPIKYSNFCITVDANEWKTIVFPTKEEAEEKLLETKE